VKKYSPEETNTFRADLFKIPRLRGAELISVAFSVQGILILTGRGFPTLAIAKGGGSSTKGRSKRPPGKVDSY